MFSNHTPKTVSNMPSTAGASPHPLIAYAKEEKKQQNPADILTTITSEQMDKAKKALEDKLDPNVCHDTFIRALHREDLATINLLYKQALERAPADGFLRVAIRAGRLKAVLLLLQLNEPVRGSDLCWLMSCSLISDYDLVPIVTKTLIDKWCAQGNYKSKLFPTIWHQRAFENDPLLEAMTPEDLNLHRGDLTPFDYACASGNPESVRRIFALYKKDEFGFSDHEIRIPNALLFAVAHNHLHIVELLVELSQIDLRNVVWDDISWNHWSPLHIASSIRMVECLLKNGLDASIRSNRGKNALMTHNNDHLFLPRDLIGKASLLREAGLDLDSKERDGNSALTFLLNQNSSTYSVEENVVMEKMKTWLVSQNSNVNMVSLNGFSPLHTAANNNAWEAAVFLLMHGANVNQAITRYYHHGPINVECTGPLVQAILSSSHALTKLLLRCNASLEQKSKAGFLPIHLVKDKKMLEIMKEHGGIFPELPPSLCWLHWNYSDAPQIVSLHNEANPEAMTDFIKNRKRFCPDDMREHECRIFLLILFHQFKERIQLSKEYIKIKYSEFVASEVVSITMRYACNHGDNCARCILTFRPRDNFLLYFYAGLLEDIEGHPQKADLFYKRAFSFRKPDEREMAILAKIYLTRAQHAGLASGSESKADKKPDYVTIERNVAQAVEVFLKLNDFHSIVEIVLALQKISLLNQEQLAKLDNLNFRNRAPEEIKKLTAQLDKFKPQLPGRDLKEVFTAQFNRLENLRRANPLGFFERRELAELEKMQAEPPKFLPLIVSILKKLLNQDLEPIDHFRTAEFVHQYYPLLGCEPAEGLAMALTQVNFAIQKQIPHLEKEWSEEDKIDSAVKLIAEKRLQKMKESDPEFKLEKERLVTAENRVDELKKNLAILNQLKTGQYFRQKIKDPLLSEALELKFALESFLNHEARHLEQMHRPAS